MMQINFSNAGNYATSIRNLELESEFLNLSVNLVFMTISVKIILTVFATDIAVCEHLPTSISRSQLFL